MGNTISVVGGVQSNEIVARRMLERLVVHGCHDLTKSIRWKSISPNPVVAGGCGDIWRGKLHDNTDVAIKVWRFRPEDAESNESLMGAMYELYCWSKIDHENIHKLLGVVIFQGRLGMVSEWMGNGNLREYIQEHEMIDRYQLCVQVTKSVQYLHQRDMLHGDLKACNFLVSSNGIVKLTDFDYSIISSCSMTFSARVKGEGGTFRWMAPELILPEQEQPGRINKQTDMYALGMTILEIITGSIPYPTLANRAVFSALYRGAHPTRTEHFQDPRGEQVWKLLVRCWSREPALRPTADEALDLITQLQHVQEPQQLKADHSVFQTFTRSQPRSLSFSTPSMPLIRRSVSTNGLRKAVKGWLGPSPSSGNADAPPVLTTNRRPSLGSMHAPTTGIASPIRQRSASSDASSLNHPGADSLSDLNFLGAQCALSLAQIESEVNLSQGLEELVQNLGAVFTAVKRARANKVQWTLLQGRCAIAVRLAGARATKHDQQLRLGQDMAADSLTKVLKKVCDCAERYHGMDEIAEFLHFQSMSAEIRNLFDELDSCLDNSYDLPPGAQSQWDKELRAVQQQELMELQRVYTLLSTFNTGLKGTSLCPERLPGRTEESNENVLNDDSKAPRNQVETTRLEDMDMFQCLVGHGCPDLTPDVDPSATFPIPGASGGSTNLWKGRLYEGTEIAIKIWEPYHAREDETKYLMAATRKLRGWMKMDHENIHKLSGVTKLPGYLGLVSKWMARGNLREYIKEGKEINRYQLCIQIARAIQYLHSKDMIHGDIRSRNFLVSSNGTAELACFGYLTTSGRGGTFLETSRTGCETLRWMAPELVPQTSRSTKQADIYALGMVLLEIITGNPPYSHYAAHDYVHSALEQNTLPERANEFQYGKGRQIWSLLEQCWDRDPAKRPTANMVLIQLLLITEAPEPQGRHSIVDSYLNEQQIVPTILAVTEFYLPPKLLIGKKSIQDIYTPLKEGITCEVYVASLLGGMQVAKKVFKIEKEKSTGDRVDRYAKRLVGAACLWNSLESEYTLPIYGIGMELLEADQHCYLYMLTPLMRNFDAMTYLERRRDGTGMKQGILRILADTALGLRYLHNRNPPVVYSGMRGDNILITDSGGAVLGEFGLTRALARKPDSDVPHEVTKSRRKSRRWMAPEQIQSTASPQTPSDVWGWAMASLEIISGELPYHLDEDIYAAIAKVYEGPPRRTDYPKFEDYAYRPDEMWELLKECWAKEPSRRPSIGAVVSRLEDIGRMPEHRKA